MFMSYVLGIDLGGSSIKTVAVTRTGELLGQSVDAFDAAANMDWARKIRAIVARMEDERKTAPDAIGFSAPGLAAKDGRSIAHMPGRLQGLEGLNWEQFLDTPIPVQVLNDAHAALLGEAWLGAAKGYQNVLMLTLGTGVGGAAIVDGRLLRGHIGRAGHLGHICLDIDGPPDVCATPGSLEVQIGNCTVVERTRGRFQNTHQLVAASRAGDLEAIKVWSRSVRALACAVASYGNILDPEAVIIGGGIALSGDALFEPLRSLVAEFEWSTTGYQLKIIPAALGEFAGAYGAAWNSFAH